MRRRNTIRLSEISGVYTCVDLTSDRLGPYVQLLRRSGVNDHTRFCSDVRWSGTIGDDDYFDAPCKLYAFTAISGSIFICASLYFGHGTEDNPLGVLLRCFDAPLSYYENQLSVPKTSDIGMSILINVK